jgi:hypothetical protein
MRTTTEINKPTNWFEKQALKFEESRFGAMTILITIQSCLGSIAAGYSFKEDALLAGTLCTAFTMMSNAAFIAQMPAKWCLSIFYAGVVVNTIIIFLIFLIY